SSISPPTPRVAELGSARAMNAPSVIWSRTNFRVVIGDAELDCAEVHGFGSETVSGAAGVAGGRPAPVVDAPGAGPIAGTPAAGTAWANDVGPWIGPNPPGRP